MSSRILLLSALLLCNLSLHSHIAAYSTSNNSKAPRILPVKVLGQSQEHNIHTNKVQSQSQSQPQHHQQHSTQISQQLPSTTDTDTGTSPGHEHGNGNGNGRWLDQSTDDILDNFRIPYGRLTNEDVESISGLMAQWARRKTTHSAIQVETLLKRVVDDHNAGNSGVKVSTRMYTMAIDAWAKTGGKQAAQRASEIHRGMVDAYRLTGDVSIRPSTISYNAVINAWSKSGCDAEAAIRAEGILGEMLEEWRRERSLIVSSEKHDTVARDNRDRDKDDNDDDAQNVTSQEDPDEIPEDDSIVKPDVVSFTSVIDTWAKSGNEKGAAKAMHLLKQMEQLHVGEGQRGMKPNGRFIFEFDQ